MISHCDFLRSIFSLYLGSKCYHCTMTLAKMLQLKWVATRNTNHSVAAPVNLLNRQDHVFQNFFHLSADSIRNPLKFWILRLWRARLLRSLYPKTLIFSFNIHKKYSTTETTFAMVRVLANFLCRHKWNVYGSFW